MNREVVTVSFFLSLLDVQLGKAKAVLKVQFSGLDLDSGLIVLTSLLSLFLGGEGTRASRVHLCFNTCFLGCENLC